MTLEKMAACIVCRQPRIIVPDPTNNKAIADLCVFMLDGESGYIAGVKLFPLLAKLNAQMQELVPGWRMRFTNRRRHAYTKDGHRVIGGRFFADYIAIDRRLSKGQRMPRVRFEVINLELFREPAPRDELEQLEAAKAILQMCVSRGVKFRSTRGSLASAMIKASPAWEPKRRPAPKFINEKARTELPGNFYSVSSKVNIKCGDCYYLDQTSAHHSIVTQIGIPHPHSIRARGYYKFALKGEYRRWIDRLPDDHIGLVYCRLQIGTISASISHLYPQWTRHRGIHYKWIFTPDMRLIQGDHRITVEGIGAALTSTTSDPVLPEYGEWSLGEIARNDGRYIKPTLLAGYGMLAFNPDGKPLYRYWGGNSNKSRVNIPDGGSVAESRLLVPFNTQPSISNVVARGMIESETRTRSIEYARELTSLGFHVVQIYADGLLVECNQLPFIKQGWKVAHALTNVSIPRPNAIVSDQIVKLPGGGSPTALDSEWRNRRHKARRPVVLARIKDIAKNPAKPLTNVMGADSILAT